MLTTQRKAMLLDRLARDGRLVATDLAAELDVSEDTIRRDLRDLAAEGRLVRVHGGALPASPTHVPLARRREMQAPEKARLGRAGARLIRRGQVVIVDGGTTHLALIAALTPDLRWSEDFAVSKVLRDEAEANAAIEAAGMDVKARLVVGPYLAEMLETPAGLQPTSARERIRASRLPTITPDQGSWTARIQG